MGRRESVVQIRQAVHDPTGVERLYVGCRRIRARTWIEVGRNVIVDTLQIIDGNHADRAAAETGLLRQMIDEGGLDVRVARRKRGSCPV